MKFVSRSIGIAFMCVCASVAWSQGTQPADAPAADLPPPTITLLEAGAQPRKELRYRYQKDAEAEMHMVMRMDLQQTIGGIKSPRMVMPAINSTMTIKVTDVDEQGDVHYQFECTRADVADEPGAIRQVVEQMRASMNSMVGLSGEGVVTNRGVTKKATINIPANADGMVRQSIESMRQSLTQFSSPMPEDPVGVGAKWKVMATISSGGMLFEQTSVMTLKSIEGDQLELDVELMQTANPQDVKLPNLPAGSMKLTSAKTEGTGQVLANLTKLVPEKSTAQVTNDTVMAITLGTPQEMKQHMTMDVTISDKPIDPGATKPAATSNE